MTTNRKLPGHAAIAPLLSAQGELGVRYEAFLDALANEDLLPRRLLELSAWRIASIHGVDPPDCPSINAAEAAALSRGVFEEFDATERAMLTVAEQVPFAHHQVSDAHVADLQAALGSSGVVAALTAMAFIDVNVRLATVAG